MNTVKTFDIEAKTWFDKVNGNSYFACLITINYGMDNEQVLKIPFTYGYGNQFEYEAIKLLKENNFLPQSFSGHFQEYCLKENIILRMSHDKNCLKRELKELVS